MKKLAKLQAFVRFLYDQNIKNERDKDSEDVQRSFKAHVRSDFNESTQLRLEEAREAYQSIQTNLDDVSFDELLEDAKYLELVREHNIKPLILLAVTSKGRFFINGGVISRLSTYMQINNHVLPLIVSLLSLLVSMIVLFTSIC
ncbi:MAG: hypothetical protein AAB395_03995 [Patescibacteria group bacterium]